MKRLVQIFANGEVAICGALAAASIYYLLIREALPHTSLSRTYGDPWDVVIVCATLVTSIMVLVGRGERFMLRAFGLIGLSTLILLIDLTYLIQRGLKVAAYAVLSNIGIVLFFAARAMLITTLAPP